MTQPATEKAPIGPSDYEGLQLDTRAKDQREKYLSQVQDVNSPQSPQSPQSPDNYQSDWNDHKKSLEKQEAIEAVNTKRDHPPKYVSGVTVGHPSPSTTGNGGDANLESKPPTVCGIRRRLFWIILVIVLVIVVIAAVVGGVVGGRRAASSSSMPALNATSSPNTTGPIPGSSNPYLPESDVMVDSPLTILSYTSSSTSDWNTSADEQAYRLYFQSAHGNIKESVSNGAGTWEAANPIFTDGINNTGLAGITYTNNSIQQSSLFYVGDNSFIQEKRLYAGTTIWEPGTLNNYGLEAFGISIPDKSKSSQDPSNAWDSYRMAAVFSTAFVGGPGARLFYHSQSGNGSSLVQEMIWVMANDSWSLGHQFLDPWPNSDLAATIDTKTNTLRLYYSSGNLTLQESWLDIKTPGAVYQSGLKITTLLAHNDASLAVVSTSTDILLYYLASVGVLSIRELTISGLSNTSSATEAYTTPANAPIVAQPALVTNNSQVSLYQPIGAVVAPATGVNQTVSVYWAEGVMDAGSGYGALKTVTRNLSERWGKSSYGAGVGQSYIPLGNNNVDPGQR